MSSPVTVWRHHKNIKNYLGKTGKILVWTRVFVAPAGYEQDVPYFVAIVQLEDGTKMPLQIVDFKREELKRNQKVITVVRRLSKVKLDEVIEYGIKAKPL